MNMAESDIQSHANFEAFRDCFFSSIVAVLSKPSLSANSKRKPSKKNSSANTNSGLKSKPTTETTSNDPAELVDFSDFIATEVFENLPCDLRELSHQMMQDNPHFAEKWSLPLTLGTLEEISTRLPPTISDSLATYGLIQPPSSDVQSFISPVLASYISAVTTPPPKWSATKATACEICERDWVPLTYHHLIPRGVHAKVLKRGWHEESMLNSVAWLCRACHTFVHKMASNEELAREWYTVEKIGSREDVQKWARWVGRVRWKKQ